MTGVSIATNEMWYLHKNVEKPQKRYKATLLRTDDSMA